MTSAGKLLRYAKELALLSNEINRVKAEQGEAACTDFQFPTGNCVAREWKSEQENFDPYWGGQPRFPQPGDDGLCDACSTRLELAKERKALRQKRGRLRASVVLVGHKLNGEVFKDEKC